MVTGTYPPARCGVGDYAASLCDALVARGAQVSVVTSAYLGTSRRSGNPAVLPVVKSWSLLNTGQALAEILRCRADIVQFQFPTTEYAAHKLFDLLVPLTKGLRPSSQAVVTFHELPELKSWLPAGIFRPRRTWLSVFRADAVVAVADPYIGALQSVFARAKHIPCKCILNASNIPRSKLSVEQLRRLRATAGAAQASLLLSYFGFVHPGKGFEQVLDVLSILRARGVAAELIVPGEFSEGNLYHRQLLARIREDRLQSFVRILGYLDPESVSNYLAMSDVCILPFTDGLHPKSGSFLAAATQGVFTITTSREKSGLMPNENVYYARPRDAMQMAWAAEQYAGRRVASGSFLRRDWASVADEHLELFAKLVDRRKLRPTAQGIVDRREKTNGSEA